MGRSRRLLHLTLLVSLSTGAFGCEFFGCGDGTLAKLIRHGPGVQRDSAAAQRDWKAASVGDRFVMGDGLRTPSDQRAELSLLPSGGMRVEPKTVVRFQNTPPGATRSRVRVDRGEISLDTEGIEIDVDTGDGLARVAPGSRVRVGTGEDGVSLRVEVGRLEIDQDGETVVIAAGESLTVEFGDLVLEAEPGATPEPEPAVADEDLPADAGVPADAAQPQDGAGDEPIAPGAALEPGVFSQPPPDVHLRLVPGESATIHDPAPPTALSIPIGCAGEGVVELRQGATGVGSIRAAGEAKVSLDAGNYAYRVRCEGDGSTRGRIGVRKDAGTRALPPRPPRVTVDADGRAYTVRYQNRLPELTFVWPGAPSASSYNLTVKLRGKRKLVRRGKTPRITLRSGQVGEGAHSFEFEAAGKRSRAGRLRIDFDNTARRAYLSRPIEGSAAPAGSLRVAGSAIAGSRVSVDGQAVPTRAQGRFSVDLPARPGPRAVAVRVRHGEGDVHYYLRHLR